MATLNAVKARPIESGGRRSLRGFFESGIFAPLLALLVHAPVLRHGLLWDDPVILAQQIPALTLRTIFNPPAGIPAWTYHYYRPVVLLSLLLDHALYGVEPIGYHATVWLLHAAATYAVFLLGRRLMAPAGALLGASLFAVFPLHPESVGWIAGRSDVLAGLFSLLAAAVFLKTAGLSGGQPGEYRMSGAAWRGEPGAASGEESPREWALKARFGQRHTGSGQDPKSSTIRPSTGGAYEPAVESPAAANPSPAREGAMWLLAASLFLMALLSKEPAIALVPFLLAAVWLARVRGRSLLGACAAAGSPVLVYLFMRTVLNPHQAAESMVQPNGPAAAAVLWTLAYLPIRLVLPIFGSSFRSAPPAGVLPAAGLLVFVAAGGLFAIRWYRGRRLDRLLPLVWIVSTMLTIAAAAAWTLTRTPVADRYFYLPAAGWCLLLGAILQDLYPAGATSNARIRSLGIMAGWGLVAAFAIGTLARTGLYSDERIFWTAAVRAEPASGAAKVNLGNALYSGGDRDGAAAVYRQALELPLSDADRALALTNLGSVLYQQGDRVQAESLLRQAWNTPGANATVAFNLGALLYQNGYERQTHEDEAAAHALFAEAAGYLTRAVQLDPYHARAWMLLGNCALDAGKTPLAREAWNRVIAIDGRDGLIGREATLALSRQEGTH